MVSHDSVVAAPPRNALDATWLLLPVAGSKGGGAVGSAVVCGLGGTDKADVCGLGGTGKASKVLY